MHSLKTTRVFVISVVLASIFWQCKEKSKTENFANEPMATPITRISKIKFGNLPDGRDVAKFTLRNQAGMEVDILNFGGIITRWTAPDRNGNFEDIVLGFDSLEPYLEENPFFGALVGRYGNRIAKAQFALDGETYTLAKNNGENHLHGGITGFNKVLWDAAPGHETDRARLRLDYRSADGEEGYPGQLDVRVEYVLTDDNTLTVSYQALTNKPTVVNLTQHTYFNLSGDFSTSILDHELQLNADTFLPVDAGLIPTGELRPVKGTPFDFTTPKTIGQDVDAENEQLALGGGYDHCWVLNKAAQGLTSVGTAFYKPSGRVLEVTTSEPGVQFYIGNFLDGTLPAKGGGTYGKRSGFCLETQHFPDSPNRPEFPTTRLNPGEVYYTETSFIFSTR